jgi:hypothetical protein
VNKDIRQTKTWKITDMASHIPEDFIQRVEPDGDEPVLPSSGRIKQLALQKRNDHLNRNEEKLVEKVHFKILLVAAIICAMSITAFAAFGGLDYIKIIFGHSAESIQNEIVTPNVTASANNREMALEAMVTDGYITNLIVSVTGDQPAPTDLFTISSNVNIVSKGWYALEQPSTSEKTFYVVDLVSEERFDTADIALSLNKNVAPINLSFKIDNQLCNAVVNFPEGSMYKQTKLKQLQISSMGFMLIGHEASVKGGLPTMSIELKFLNKKTENLEVEFEESDSTVTGGGCAIMADDPQTAPLVIKFHGTRNPEGELVISGQFSRIINPSEIEKVIIDGFAYTIN